MSYATFLILKYKYYTHHIITLIIYCILGLGIDLIFGSFTNIEYIFIYFFIVYIINEVLMYYFLKYMMDKLYYHYTEIILYHGIIRLIQKSFIFSGWALYGIKMI